MIRITTARTGLHAVAWAQPSSQVVAFGIAFTRRGAEKRLWKELEKYGIKQDAW